MEVVPGKHESWPPLSAMVAGAQTVASSLASLFKAYDFVSGLNFLVNTGSQISILPASKSDKDNRSKGDKLLPANGTTLAMYRWRSLPLRFGELNFQWSFIVADVTQPIIGADFLCAQSLMVDVKGCRLVNIENFEMIRVESDSSPILHVSAVDTQCGKFEDLLATRPKLTMPIFMHPRPAHGVRHFVKTTGAPVHAQARHLSPEKVGGGGEGVC